MEPSRACLSGGGGVYVGEILRTWGVEMVDLGPIKKKTGYFCKLFDADEFRGFEAMFGTSTALRA